MISAQPAPERELQFDMANFVTILFETASLSTLQAIRAFPNREFQRLLLVIHHIFKPKNRESSSAVLQRTIITELDDKCRRVPLPYSNSNGFPTLGFPQTVVVRVCFAFT